jgi:hypothetical protein
VIRTRVKQSTIGSALGIIVAAQLFLFMPFTLYVGNSGEFTVSFGAIFSGYLPLAVLLVGILVLVAIVFPRSLYQSYLCLIATLSILIWLQGNLLVWDYGLLDGRAIDWRAGAMRGLLELSIWLSALAAAVIYYQQLGQITVRVAMALFFVQATMFAYNSIQHTPESPFQADSANTARALKEIYQFSSQENVVQIIADGFQSDIFAEIIEEDKLEKRFTNAFDGFTFFREHMGVFPYTHMTLPAILSGKIYRNHIPIKEHMASTVGGETILSVANDAGYEIDLIVPAGLANIYSTARHTNFYKVTSQHHISGREIDSYEAAKLIDLTLFRISPHFLKKYIYNDQLWLVQSLTIDRKYMTLDFFSHTTFLRNLVKQMSVDRSAPVYKLIHLMLSHNPMVTTGQCAYAGRVLPTIRETVKSQARCGLIEIVNLLENMKRLEIYHDATIVLMADHGAWVPPKEIKAIRNQDGVTVDIINPSFLALSVPLLAVKRPGDNGPLKLSDAPSWIVDTAATIADVLGLKSEFSGKSVFDLDASEPRERRHNIYVYRRSEWTDDYLSPIEEFIVSGSVFDSSSWRYNVTHHPGAKTEHSQARSSVWQTLRLQ